MWFEIYRRGNLIKRGTDLIGGIRWSNELMYIPTTTIRIPITYREYLNGHDEFKIFVNDKVFWGVIKKVVEDKENEVLRVYLDHVVCEWEYRQIAVNNAIKDSKVNIVYKGSKTTKNGGVSVSASDFTIFLGEVGSLTSDVYILRAGASAWTADGNTLPVSVDTSNIVSKAGEYDVTFSAGGASVTVTATVEAAPRDATRDGMLIRANNFSIGVEDVGSLTPEWCIDLADAEITWDPEAREGAWKPVTLPTLKVDRSNVRAQDGEYRVRFYGEYVDEEGEDAEISTSVTCVVAGDNFADPTVADNLADIYGDMNFAYPGWHLNYEQGAEDYTIDYVYSRQNKLDALTKTMELTTDLFWRVRMVNERVIDISPFGAEKDLILSGKQSGVNNRRIITDPTITHEYDHVINVATVYSEKSDTGMSSLTLREIYNDPSLQVKGFPVVILRANVNNERDYRMYSDQYPKLAPNNELEYAVIDEESVALESGTLIEGSFGFNDISPFASEVEEIDEQTHAIADSDRILAAQMAYNAAIRKLKYARRKYEVRFPVEELPADIAPGDKVRLVYDNSLWIAEDCSAYEKMILQYDDFMYVTRIVYDIDVNGAEVDTITLENELRVDREGAWN